VTDRCRGRIQGLVKTYLLVLAAVTTENYKVLEITIQDRELIHLSSASVYLRTERRKLCTAEQNAPWENNRKRPLEDQKDGETWMDFNKTGREQEN